MASGNDRVVWNPLKVHVGNCAFRFAGDPEPEAATLKQVIRHGGVAGDSLDLKLFVRAIQFATGHAKVVLMVNDTPTGEVEQAVLDIPGGTYPYQELNLGHQVGSINPALTVYDRIILKIKAVAMASGNTLFVDDLTLAIASP